MSFLDSLKRFFGRSGNGARAQIPCHEALRLVHEFIDGELDNVSHAEVEAHFDVCQRCYPHLRLERRFREAVRRACAKETAPEELRERVLHIVSEGGSDA